MDLRRLFWALLPLALVALMVGAVACGGDDDDDAGNGDDASEDGGGAGRGDDDGGGDDSSGDGPDDDGGSDDGDDDNGSGGGSDPGTGSDDDGDGLDFLRQTAASLENDTYFVTYDVQGEGLAGTFTFASKPPQQLFAIEGEFEGESGTIMLISDDEFLYFCTDSDGEQQCLKTKAGSSLIPLGQITSLQTDEFADQVLNAPNVQSEPAGSRTIAGISAECYNVTSEGETMLMCADDKTMLLLEGTFEGQAFRFEATTVERDAGKIEITVPDWPVQDLTAVTN